MSEFSIFMSNITSYPTVIFTGFLILASLYWLTTILGFTDMDTVDLDIDVDVGDVSGLNFISGIMMRFGLYGIPVVVIFSLFSLIGWVLSYIYASFLNSWFPTGVMHYVFGTGAFILVAVISMWLTGLMLTPIRKKIEKIPRRNSKSFIGQIAIVRSFKVDQTHGEATLEDGGAGLIFKVRAMEGNTFSLNDKVVLLEYLSEENAYRVISEEEYLG